jgi:UDP-glucose 4-epimerase
VNVVVLDNLYGGSSKNVEAHIENSHFRFVNGDVRDFEVLKRLVADVDCVVHFAAVTSVPFSVKEPVLTHEVNVAGTLNLLKACLDSKVERFVFTSSCAVYGEPHYLPVNEDHPVFPVSPYATSKLTAEHYCRVFFKSYGLKTVVLRLFNVYGLGQGVNGEGGVIAKFMEHLRLGLPLIIYGDGEQTRDFVHVEDVVDAVLLVLKNKDIEGEVFNVGSGSCTSINNLAKNVIELAPANLGVAYGEHRLGDVRHSFANIEKARKELGYEPKISLHEGLKSLLREEYQKIYRLKAG